MPDLKPPIIVIGGTRSGTSMLCELLGTAPGLCVWYEPNVIWRIGSAYGPDDTVAPGRATAGVKKRIRRLFLRYQQQHDGARIVEKTPYNVVRVPFVNEVFPDAVFVHIYRDGRANLRSQVEKFETFRPYSVGRSHTRKLIADRLSTVPWWEWPAYAPRMAQGVARLVTKREALWWGLRYPGWREDRTRLTKAQISAKQWKISVEQAFADLDPLPEHRRIHVRYEDITREPDRWFRTICEFCGVEADDAFFSRVSDIVHPDSIERWRHELNPQHLDEAMPIIRDLLEKLGYLEGETAPAGGPG